MTTDEKRALLAYLHEGLQGSHFRGVGQPRRDLLISAYEKLRVVVYQESLGRIVQEAYEENK